MRSDNVCASIKLSVTLEPLQDFCISCCFERLQLFKSTCFVCQYICYVRFIRSKKLSILMKKEEARTNSRDL